MISASEINAFIFSAIGGDEENPDARFYHHLKFLEQKVDFSEQEQLVRQLRMQLCHQKICNYATICGNLLYLYGIANILWKDIIDLDKSGFLETIDRKYGKSRVGRNVQEIGPYGYSKKVNVLIAISADEIGERHLERNWY